MVIAVSVKLRADSTRAAQWNIIRYCYKCGEAFTAKELAMVSYSTLSCVRQFLLELKNAGFIKRVGYARHEGALWQLALDIGPKPPVHRANGMYDPNSSAVFENRPKTKPIQNAPDGA